MIIRFIWELPQNLLGLLLIKLTKAENIGNHTENAIYKAKKDFGMYAVSLGRYIIVSEEVTPRIIRHEYGHCRQSKMLGWLYLIVIGIPSFVMNRLTSIGILDNRKYYDRWPETWADKLGGVDK